MQLPDPPLLLVTDRAQARRALAEIVGKALAGGCRWVSLREKDLPEDEQVLLLRSLLPMARKHGARLMLHGEAALAKLAGADGVHLPSGGDAAAARVTARRQANSSASRSIPSPKRKRSIRKRPTMRSPGPAFETPSKPGYGPEIGRKGLGRNRPRVARSGARHRRDQHRARRRSDRRRLRRRRGDGRRHARRRSGARNGGARRDAQRRARQPRAWYVLMPCSGAHTPDGSLPACQNTSIGMPPRG